MYTYKITGPVNYNEAETEDGYATVNLDETFEVAELGCQNAKDKFFEQNPQYDDFFGRARSHDVKTCGNELARFVDRTCARRVIFIEHVTDA